MNEDRLRKFFHVAFKIKNNHPDFGVHVDIAKKYIGSEFDIVSETSINRIYDEMIMSKFLFVGISGIKANEFLEEEYQTFIKKAKGAF